MVRKRPSLGRATRNVARLRRFKETCGRLVEGGHGQDLEDPVNESIGVRVGLTEEETVEEGVGVEVGVLGEEMTDPVVRGREKVVHEMVQKKRPRTSVSDGNGVAKRSRHDTFGSGDRLIERKSRRNRCRDVVSGFSFRDMLLSAVDSVSVVELQDRPSRVRV